MMKTGIGLAAGAVIVLIVHSWNGGASSELIQPAALLFVVLGTLLATYLSGGRGDLMKALSLAGGSDEATKVALHKELSEIASVARKEGFLALDPLKATASRASLREGIQYLISGFDQTTIRDLFDAAIERQTREREGIVRVWEVAAQAAPSVGALGATLGLLSALARLDDPSKLGRGIGSAMAAVFYGFFFANFVFGPLAARMRRGSNESLAPEEMVKSAILGMQEGLNPQLIDERLKRFVSVAPANKEAETA
jgi:chemotaxis protein MotA